jgi:hypothetical protein
MSAQRCPDCHACQHGGTPDALARRARIAAALIAGDATPEEDVASIACRIDDEIEAITRGEQEPKP